MSTEALELRTKAESGDAKAQYEYARSLEFGTNQVQKDKKEATRYYILAAEQGHREAQTKAAFCYMLADGVDRDEKQGLHYYTLAADAGVTDAALMLGMYYGGTYHGAVKDPTLALKYYTLAADGGDEAAQILLAGFYQHGDTSVVATKDEKLSAHYYTLVANQGFDEALFHLGVFYEKGLGVKQDLNKARDYIQRAADRRNPDAQLYLGQCYENGTLFPKDEKTAFDYYAANRFSTATAKYHLGRCYHLGIGVSVDKGRAFELYKQAADDLEPDPNAQHEVGYFYETGEPKSRWFSQNGYKNPAQAIHYYKLAADGKSAHPEAQYRLAYHYEQGIGVQKDTNEAVRRYRLAAAQGHALAQNSLGNCYQYGSGVEKDEKKAVELYTQAAEQKCAAAQNSLGFCYENGIAVKADAKKAFGLYKQAADQHASAQCNLGRCYLEAIGAPKDEKQAFTFFELAANQNDAQGQYMLGRCYEEGIGVHPNFQTAIQLYRKAAVKNLPDARIKLRRCYEESIINVPKDDKQAFKFYQQLSDKDPFAAFMLGLCFFHGKGTPKDLPEAIRLLEANKSFGNMAGENCGIRIINSHEPVAEQKEKSENKVHQYFSQPPQTEPLHSAHTVAAEQGDAGAQYWLARDYQNSRTPNAEENAVKYYKLSAEQWHLHAIFHIAVSCTVGMGGFPKDPKESVRQYTRAANLGYGIAQYELGQCYEKGVGVEDEKPDMGKAIYYYQLAADQGGTPALRKLGELFQHGSFGVEKDEKAAFECYQRATELGDKEARFSLAHCYEHGIGVEKSAQEALRLYQINATLKHKESQYRLARCYEHGELGLAKNPEEALRLYRLYAMHNTNNTDCQYRLGLCYERGELGLAKNANEAFKYYNLAAACSHIEALFKVGECYEHGRGVQVDSAEAVKHYKYAAREEHAAAQNNLADCYKQGLGIKADEKEAFRLYQLAAEQGYAAAQNNLGDCYYYGIGTFIDYEKAIYYYRLAASQEHDAIAPVAQYNLGLCYEAGRAKSRVDKGAIAPCPPKQSNGGHATLSPPYEDDGYKPDLSMALNFYKQSANQGHAPAQFKLGVYFENGIEGITPDLKKAVHYYRLAADDGNLEALSALERLSKEYGIAAFRTKKVPSYVGTFLFFSDPQKPVDLYEFPASENFQLEEKSSIPDPENFSLEDGLSPLRKIPVFSSIQKERSQGFFKLLPDGQVEQLAGLQHLSSTSDNESSSSTTTQAPLSR